MDPAELSELTVLLFHGGHQQGDRYATFRACREAARPEAEAEAADWK